jgi:hypothetical protein
MRQQITGRRVIIGGLAAASLIAGALHPAVAAEEATIEAFANWQGQGQLIETGSSEMTFVGTLAGPVYAETEKGPVRAGQLVCPAMVRINIADGTQTGTGRCTIKADDGSQAFADVACTGVHLVGCDGEFTLTGGAGRFEGIAGGGPVTLRSHFVKIDGVTQTVAQEEATGIMFWPALRYTLP